MPTIQQVHIDKALTQISVAYKNEQFIADKIFLPVSVDKQSDKYYVYGKDAFRVNDDRRAPGTEANEINWTLSLDTYFCDGHALRHAIPDEEVQNADSVFDLEADATELVTDGILLNKEIDAANKLLDPANYDSSLVLQMGTTVAKWSDFQNSNPILDIETAKQKIHKKSGLRPNTLIISETVYNVLKVHPALLKIYTYTQAVGVLTLEQIKMALGIDNILVGSALKMGTGDNLDYIWGNSAVLAYIPSKPGKRVPAIGYSFMWNKDGEGAVYVRKWYDVSRRATIIEAERYYDQKIICPTAGFLFVDAVTPLGQ